MFNQNTLESMLKFKIRKALCRRMSDIPSEDLILLRTNRSREIGCLCTINEAPSSLEEEGK